MHISITVAIDGSHDVNELPAAVGRALEPYGDVDQVVDAVTARGRWEGWIAGGRRVANHWILTHQSHVDTASPPWQWPNQGRGYIARLHDIEPTSLTATTGYIDLDGSWHDSGRLFFPAALAPDDPEVRRWRFDYSAWIATVPENTWLILIDAHR